MLSLIGDDAGALAACGIGLRDRSNLDSLRIGGR